MSPCYLGFQPFDLRPKSIGVEFREPCQRRLRPRQLQEGSGPGRFGPRPVAHRELIVCILQQLSGDRNGQGAVLNQVFRPQVNREH